MTLPNLKRVKLASEMDLKSWLSKNRDHASPVMLVTHANPAHPNHVSRQQVADALVSNGWSAGKRYTLNPTLLGHVIEKTAT